MWIMAVPTGLDFDTMSPFQTTWPSVCLCVCNMAAFRSLKEFGFLHVSVAGVKMPTRVPACESGGWKRSVLQSSKHCRHQEPWGAKTVKAAKVPWKNRNTFERPARTHTRVCVNSPRASYCSCMYTRRGRALRLQRKTQGRRLPRDSESVLSKVQKSSREQRGFNETSLRADQVMLKCKQM